jgi:hypothetical protein
MVGRNRGIGTAREYGHRSWRNPMRPRKMPWLPRRPSGYPDDLFLAGLDGLQKCRTLDISWVIMRFRIRYLHVAMQVAVITEAVAFVGLVLRVVRVVADEEVMIGVCV